MIKVYGVPISSPLIVVLRHHQSFWRQDRAIDPSGCRLEGTRKCRQLL